MVKNAPGNSEERVRSLGWEDVEEEMIAHPSTPARKTPWAEKPSYRPWGPQRVGHSRTHTNLLDSWL